MGVYMNKDEEEESKKEVSNGTKQVVLVRETKKTTMVLRGLTSFERAQEHELAAPLEQDELDDLRINHANRLEYYHLIVDVSTRIAEAVIAAHKVMRTVPDYIYDPVEHPRNTRDRNWNKRIVMTFMTSNGEYNYKNGKKSVVVLNGEPGFEPMYRGLMEMIRLTDISLWVKTFNENHDGVLGIGAPKISSISWFFNELDNSKHAFYIDVPHDWTE